MALVRLDHADAVATLSLTRPDKRNALSPALLGEFLEALAHAAQTEPRVLVLRGEGPVFCAGGDIDGMRERLGKPKVTEETLRRGLNAVVRELIAFPAPTVAAVQGAAIGAGLGLVLACDVVVAAEDARLGATHARLGLTPDGGTSWWLPRLVGPKRALALVLGAETLDGTAAAELGLVTQVAAPSELDAAVARWADRLATGPTKAYVQARRLLLDGLTRGLADQLEAEAVSQGRMYATEDQREGVEAFLDKRDARFSNR